MADKTCEAKPWVYIASPYTKGDPAINTRFQCATWDSLVSDGVVWPIAPLWSHFQHIIFPRPYPFWIAYDNAMIDRFDIDACLRLNAVSSVANYCVSESSGADAEVNRFRDRGKPVFYSIAGLYEWVRNDWCGEHQPKGAKSG